MSGSARLYLAAAAYNAGAGKVSRSLGKLQWDGPRPTAATRDAEALRQEDDSERGGRGATR